MVLGIILIIIGVIGAIVTLIYGIKFMKKNNIIFKSDYIELVRENIVQEEPVKKQRKEKNKKKKEKSKPKNERYEEAEGTDLLEDNINIAEGNVSLDTQLLDFDSDTDILLDEVSEKVKTQNKNSEDTMILDYENNSSDTELLM